MHKIGYYVNNHGAGHANRLFCFLKELNRLNYNYKLFVFCEDISKLNSLGIYQDLHKVHLIELPKPNWKVNKEYNIYHCLPKNYVDYFGLIVKTCIEEGISTFVSDLSVEVGQAVRLHVDKLVYILLHGSRVDRPHQNLFNIADKLIVPFSEKLKDNYFIDFEKEFNIVYSNGFLKFQYQKHEEYLPEEYSSDKKNILVILGTGGNSFDSSYIDTNEDYYSVVVLGNGVFKNPYNYIRCADVVVANSGDSIMHEIAYFNKPYICIPEERPFKEQEIKAYTLEREKLALVSFWKGSLEEDLYTLSKLPKHSKSILINSSRAKSYAREIIES